MSQRKGKPQFKTPPIPRRYRNLSQWERIKRRYAYLPVSTERVFGIGFGVMVAGIVLQVIISKGMGNKASYIPFFLLWMISMVVFTIGGFLITVREKGLDLKQPLRYPTEGTAAVIEGIITMIFSISVFLGMLYAILE